MKLIFNVSNRLPEFFFLRPALGPNDDNIITVITVINIVADNNAAYYWCTRVKGQRDFRSISFATILNYCHSLITSCFSRTRDGTWRNRVLIDYQTRTRNQYTCTYVIITIVIVIIGISVLRLIYVVQIRFRVNTSS